MTPVLKYVHSTSLPNKHHEMRIASVIFLVALTTTYGFYLAPNVPRLPSGITRHSRAAPVFKNLGDFFQRLHRCANLFDESCHNGDMDGAGSDESWIHGGDTPGKRCANIFDESCNNGDMDGADEDEDWINGGGTPGKRSLNPLAGLHRTGRR